MVQLLLVYYIHWKQASNFRISSTQFCINTMLSFSAAENTNQITTVDITHSKIHFLLEIPISIKYFYLYFNQLVCFCPDHPVKTTSQEATAGIDISQISVFNLLVTIRSFSSVFWYIVLFATDYPVVNTPENGTVGISDLAETTQDNLMEPLVTTGDNAVDPNVTTQDNLMETPATTWHNLMEPLVTTGDNLMEGPATTPESPKYGTDLGKIIALVLTPPGVITICIWYSVLVLTGDRKMRDWYCQTNCKVRFWYWIYLDLLFAFWQTFLFAQMALLRQHHKKA